MRLTELNCYNGDPVYNTLKQDGLLESESFWIGVFWRLEEEKQFLKDKITYWVCYEYLVDAINMLHQDGSTNISVECADNFDRGWSFVQSTIICNNGNFENVSLLVDSMRTYYESKYDFGHLFTLLFKEGCIQEFVGF